MDVDECQDYYTNYSDQHRNDVPAHIAANLKQKRALECMMMRDAIYSQFGIRYEYTAAMNDFLYFDGPGDGGCDQHIIDDEGERVILIQSKISDITVAGTWTMAYHMTAAELGRIEDFIDSILAGTAKANVTATAAIAGGSARETELHDRIDDIYNAITVSGYDVCLVQLCSGTFAAHWDATQLPAIRVKGWHGYAIGSDDIAHHATEALALDSTGGEPAPIRLNFITLHSSTDDTDIIHGYITASSLNTAVLQEGWKLTRQNLRHFKGTTGTVANAGMVDTLNNSPQKFHLFNNGLRITCSEISKVRDATETDSGGTLIDVEEWELENAQIVNGGQTSFSIRRYGGATNLADVKVGCLVIKEEDQDILRNIARYSNTQEALDDWDFHSDSDEFLLLKEQIGLVVFDVMGDEKSFYLDQKSGAFEFLTNPQKAQHRIPRNAGKAIHYRIHPLDFGKASLIMNGEPSIAKSSAKRCHATNATGKYKEIFVDEPFAPKPILYTNILLHQCKALLKTRVEAGGPPFLNQAVAHLASLFHDFIFEICDDDADMWNETIEGYFDAIVWDDGVQGKKINDIICNKFGLWFGAIMGAWSAHMQGTHFAAGESANTFFNGPNSSTICIEWMENWIAGNIATPHPVAANAAAGETMHDAVKANYV